MGAEICFDDYLRSVVSAYQQWWRLYTLTDATGRESQRVERDRIAPAFFDFGLMVQMVEPPKAEQERESEDDREKKEKIERLPVLEGICKYAAEHVLLVGRPGSGKSTALARLLLQEAENALSDRNAKIPVLLELRYLPSEANESSVGDRILAFMHKHDPALDIDEAGIKLLLRQGRLLLLVDGVNELPSDRGRVMVNQFRELYQKTCPMIFTTRELSAGGDLGIAKRLEMQPLTEPQMQQFVMAYLPTQGERLLRQLSGRLREFGQTPLLLWMLCSLFQQSEQIPPNLGMVFRAFTVGYGDRIKQDVTLSKDSRAWWGRLLQYLAFKMTCGENLTELQVAISRREAEQFLVEFLWGKVEFADDCAVRWLEDLLKHHLIQISNDRIEFRHQLIQEYYAAEWLLGLLPSLSDARLQQVYLNYLKWTEPLALMLELVDGEEQAVRVVRLALAVDLRLGARLAGAVKYGFQEKTVGLLMREIEERKIPKLYAIELFGETRSDYTNKLLIQALKNPNHNVRRKTADVLGKIGGDKAVESLVLALKDSDYAVRRKTVDVLGKIGSNKAVAPLIQALKDSDNYVRENAVEALGKIGGEKAVEALIQTLEDSDDNVSWNVVVALDMIGSDRAIEALIQTLKDSDDNVRWNTIEALSTISNDKVIEPLIQSLKDPDDNIRWKVAEALGMIGNDQAIKPLIQSLKDPDDDVRWKVAEALGMIGNDQAIKPLIQSLKDSNYAVRGNSAKALGMIGNEKTIEPLIQSLKDSEIYVRRKAIEALGKIGCKNAVAPIIQALKDSDYSVRWEATDALSKIGCKNAVEPIIQTLKDLDCNVRRKAADALGKIGCKNAVKPLIQALKDSDCKVRRIATDALGMIGSDRAIEALIQALKDSDDHVRWTAVKALGMIGSDKAVEPLIQSLKDSDNFIGDNALEALGAIGSVKAIEALIQFLKNSNDAVRGNAVEILGEIGSDKVVEPLMQSLKDSNDYVRMNAVEALGKIGSNKAVEPLIRSLKDSNYYVSWNAAEALANIGSDCAVEPLIQSLKDSDNYVRMNVVELLGKIANFKAVGYLVQSLQDTDDDVWRNAIEALGRIAESDRNLPTLTQQLPHLLTLISTESSEQALSVITTIQARCKYYNYDIAQIPLPPEDKPNPTTGNTYNNFNAPVGQVVENLTVQRDNIATQNNPKPAPES
jgi:HEAT repeat protein